MTVSQSRLLDVTFRIKVLYLLPTGAGPLLPVADDPVPVLRVCGTKYVEELYEAFQGEIFFKRVYRETGSVVGGVFLGKVPTKPLPSASHRKAGDTGRELTIVNSMLANPPILYFFPLPL